MSRARPVFPLRQRRTKHQLRLLLAMQTAMDDGRLRKGDLVLLASVGAGFTVGATLLRWTI